MGQNTQRPLLLLRSDVVERPIYKDIGTQPAAGIADSNGIVSMRPVQVATNMKMVELIVNKRSAGKIQSQNGLCEWKVQFVNGVNTLEVIASSKGKTYTDKAAIQFCLLPEELKNTNAAFTQINILLGSRRYFRDKEQQMWIPDQAYKQGSWGYIGGKIFTISGNTRLPYGTDKNILGTTDDPIYQTQQVGINKYKIDVPAGEYDLTLHFAELLGGVVKEIPYNLSDPDRIEPNGKRIFNVYINSKLMLDSFNISAQYGAATAVAKTIRVLVADNNGIEIDFKSIEGEPVLNALQIKKAENRQSSIPLSTGD